MGAFSPLGVACILSWAGMLTHGAAEQQYFLQTEKLSWDAARSHCQVCFDDLVTVTPFNIRAVVTEASSLTSDSWIGLRKNPGSGSPAFWSHWANGDPLTFQNWYPSWPVFNTATQSGNVCYNCRCTRTNSNGIPYASGTCTSPVLAPISVPAEITDSCVAMRNFGAWVEKKCTDLQPFICYEDVFLGQASATGVTKASATLKWQAPQGTISQYNVTVIGDGVTQAFSETGLTMPLSQLTAGTHYSVRVFPLKCGRSLHPQDVDFYTIPNKIDFLNVTNVTMTSVALSWEKPDGNVDFYLVTINGETFWRDTEVVEVEDLTPGAPHPVIVLSGVLDNVTYSEEYNDIVYTKPGKVSDVKVSESKPRTLLVQWQAPLGHARSYIVKATTEYGDFNHDKEVVETTTTIEELPMGAMVMLNITAVASHTVIGEDVSAIGYTAPDPVSNLTADTTNATLTASWDASEGNFSFRVTLRHGNEWVGNTSVTAKAVTFSSLKSAAMYTVEVYSVKGPLESTGVQETAFTLADPPSDLNVTYFNQSSITIEWKPPAKGASSRFLLSINSSFWQYEYSTDVLNVTSYMFVGLRSGTRYDLRVQTGSGKKWSAPAVLRGAYTVEDKMEIDLSMLCSSETTLLCDEVATRRRVLQQLESHFGSVLGNNVFWKLEHRDGFMIQQEA